MDNKDRIKRIVEKLKTVKKKGFTCFGADSHKFKLNPPIKLKEIEEFEKQHNIRLPEDYRDFLLYAGNGGAGPYYGIFPLKKWDNFQNWVIEELPDDFLSRPNHFKPGWNEMPEEFSDDDDIYDQQHIDLYQGTLTIGTQGCTYNTLLVITGEYRGRVVYVDADDQSPYLSREKTFLDWYERWLDEMLNGYNTGSFGFGPGGSAEDFFRIIETSTDDEEISEAFAAFGRLPKLTNESIHKLNSYINSEKDSIRAAIYWVIWKHSLEISYRDTEKGLKDPAPKVRENAILVAMKKNFRHFRPILFEMALRDPNKEVAENAYLKISSPEKYSNITIPFTRQECLQLFQSSHSAIRWWILHNEAFTPEDADIFISLLDTGSAMSKADAITRLHNMKITKAIPHVLKTLEKERNKQPEEKVYDDCYVIDRAMKMLGEMGNQDVVPELLQWTEHPGDDFYRINSVAAIAQIGDERVIPIAKKMLSEEKEPRRCTLDGFTSVSNIHPIKYLIKKELNKSPNKKIRELK